MPPSHNDKTIILKNVKKIYGQPDQDGPMSIVLKNGVIDKIAPYDQLTKVMLDSEKSPTIIDCFDRIVMPGFIDSHTHLLFSGSREAEFYLRAKGASYLDILSGGGGIYSTVDSVRRASEDELIENAIKYLDKALEFGITTIEIKSGYGLDYQTEEKMLRVLQKLNSLHPLDIIPTYLVHAVPRETDRKNYVDSVIHGMLPDFRALTSWFDIFLEKGVFAIDEAERMIRRAAELGYSIGLHTNQVNDMGGISLANEYGVRHVDHLEVLSDADAERIIQNPNLYAVFLPAAEYFVFSKKVGQVKKLSAIPSRIVFATDFNPGSSPVLFPQVVMSLAILRYRLADPGLLQDGFTVNPARMLGLSNRGVIETGAAADVICLQLDRFEQIPYLGTFNFITHVIKGGRLVLEKLQKKRAQR
jgi:imidazolonepropionase